VVCFVPWANLTVAGQRRNTLRPTNSNSDVLLLEVKGSMVRAETMRPSVLVVYIQWNIVPFC
jgi:hypothetical protein